MVKFLAVIVLFLQFVYADVHNTTQEGPEGNSALLITAAQNGDSEMLKALLEKDSNVNAKDGFGTTALMYASAGAHASCVKLLLENGADVNVQDNKGYTALWLARQNHNSEISSMLLAYGADQNLTPSSSERVVDFEDAAPAMKWVIAVIFGALFSIFLLPFVLIWLVLMLFFVLTQNSLIDAYAKKCAIKPVNKAWTWTQLIPIWGIVALIVSIIKLSEANKRYSATCGRSSYSAVWGWIYVVSIFLTFGTLAVVFWVVYWVNVSNAAREILYNEAALRKAV